MKGRKKQDTEEESESETVRFESEKQVGKNSVKTKRENQVGKSSGKMENLDGFCLDSSESPSLNPTTVEFDSSQPIRLNSMRHKPLSLNSLRQEFDSVEPLSLNSMRQEPLSLNFDSVEPLSLEYEYEIEGLGRPQQQEHCTR